MKKKYLIVIADYYKDIAKGLLDSALKLIPKSSSVKIIRVPGVDSFIKPTTIDLIVFIIFEIGIIYGIFLLYKLKKLGGYWFLGSNVLFTIYASIFGPIAEIGIYNILLPIVLFFCLYIFLTILIPWFYSDKFE